MKSVVGGIVLAIALFVVGVAARNEADVTRRVAEAHRRLATLHYDTDENIDSAPGLWDKLPLPLPSNGDDVKRHHATVSYWLARYEELTKMASATGAQALTDPAGIFTAANAAFRNVAPQLVDRKAAVERLDAVIQQYADVLRKDPSYSDAAYNFEFVTRVRDAVAKAPASKGGIKSPVSQPALVSVDLPTGPTVHGRPGGPPEDVPMSDFKTVTPMSYEEREEQMDPGRGAPIKRKG